MSGLGLVAIGRNEGQRLQRCLQSARQSFDRIVYVDSGSTDGSVAYARSVGAEVVCLDPAAPFTAARARNTGFARLKELLPQLELVQFVDGDCELAQGWVSKALAHLAGHPRAAVVCGRRRERYPERSIYNRLCDLEWDTPVGRTEACGGDAMVRAGAFEQVDGFLPHLIAGEEPDLCFRLRKRGWEIWRIDADMTLHDADMTRFSQWWQRNVRSGHATAEELHMRRQQGDKGPLKKVASNVFWSLPGVWPLWPVLWYRIYRRQRDATCATFTVLGKLPHCQGQLRFWRNQLRGEAGSLIEYK